MIIISLGSNVVTSDKFQPSIFPTAYRLLETFPILVKARSRVYLTRAFGKVDQPDYINAAARIETSLPPQNLLKIVKKIEAVTGRGASRKWMPRTLDIDIIDYQGIIMKNAEKDCGDFAHANRPLILPHPGIARRPFVLQPICDIAPFWHHPVTGLTASQMLKRLPVNAEGAILKTVA